MSPRLKPEVELAAHLSKDRTSVTIELRGADSIDLTPDQARELSMVLHTAASEAALTRAVVRKEGSDMGKKKKGKGKPC